MPRTKRKDLNLLDLIPVQRVDWEKKEDGTVYLKKPKAQNRFMKHFIQKMGKSPDYKIHLDDFGSYVWQKCDGAHRVDQIGECLKREFGEKVEPVVERLASFVKILAYQKCIGYKGISDSKS
ncbi:MAG: PqqD family protein [bacterium]